MEGQKKTLEWLYGEAVKRGADVGILGDIFHRSQDHSSVLYLFLDVVNRFWIENRVKTYFIAGNHDLLYHSEKNIDKSLIGIPYNLAEAGGGALGFLWEIGKAGNFGGEFKDVRKSGKILFAHVFVDPRMNMENLLSEINEKWVIFGDNHVGWEKLQGKQKVVNLGCISVQTADLLKLKYKPSAFYLNLETDEYERIYVPNFFEYIEVGDEEDMKGEIKNKIFLQLSNIIKNRGKRNLLVNFPYYLKEFLEKNEDKDLEEYLLRIMEEEKI